MTGVEDYSGFEVIRAAMEIEKNGHRFYSAMVAKAHSELAREIFSWLAQDEVQHLRTLEGIIPRFQEGAFWEEEEEFLPYLRRFAEDRIFPAPERLGPGDRGRGEVFRILQPGGPSGAQRRRPPGLCLAGGGRGTSRGDPEGAQGEAGAALNRGGL